MMDAILYSVIGGFIVLVVLWLWNNVIPLLVDRFYHHEPSVGGEWRTQFKEGDEEYHEIVTLKQKGRNVSGKIILREGDSESEYRFRGIFKHLIMTCTYSSTDPAEYEQGVFALQYKTGRRKGRFEGQHVLLSKESEDLISSPYIWERA